VAYLKGDTGKKGNCARRKNIGKAISGANFPTNGSLHLQNCVIMRIPQQEKHMKTEKKMIEELGMYHYVLEEISTKVGLEGRATLEEINTQLQEYVGGLISDLEYHAGQHDPSHGIDSKWLWDLIDELKAEFE